MMNIQLIVYVSVFFFLSEFALGVVKYSGKKGVKAKNDRMSMIFIWITITTGITMGFWTADHGSWSKINDFVAILGLCILLAGSIIRWISILQLKHEFTVNVVIREDHKLKTNGMYKNIRHPSYLGLLMICLGLSVAMNSALSILVTVVPVLLAVLYRIQVEENILTKEFGVAHKKYREKTFKIIPKVY